jgi:hypothetical protein
VLRYLGLLRGCHVLGRKVGELLRLPVFELVVLDFFLCLVELRVLVVFIRQRAKEVVLERFGRSASIHF